MRLFKYISLLVLLLSNILTATAQENRLIVPDITTTAGRTIAMPVNMDISADIVAVQFTITVPQGFSLDTNPRLSERAADHSVTMRYMGNQQYTVLIFSPENKSFKGRTGQLLSVGLTAYSVDENSTYSFQLSDVVLSGRDGTNLCTGYYAGNIFIAQSSDLEVSAVQASAATVAPGDRLQVGWQVKNIGGLATEAGWNERIYLNSPDGQSTLLGTAYYDGTLDVGALLSRSVEVELPAILGIHGQATVSVKLTAHSNTGEPSWLQANNTAYTASSLTVVPLLTLTPNEARVDEANGKYVRFYLQRSGSTTADETFALTATADSRISLPESVTIGKAQSGTYFYAQVKANGVLDDNDAVSFTISGNDYAPAGATLTIEDDTFPSLTLTSASQDVEEGKTIAFTITAQRAPEEDLEIKLASDFSSRFNVPAVVLPAGQTSLSATVEAKQDDVPDVEQVVTFTASAAGYNSASLFIVLVDDDVPTLQLTLTPDAVSEAAGPLAVVAKLRRTDNINKLVTVKFSDDSNGQIFYGHQSIEMAAGVEEVTVNLGPVDNAIVDGERTYNISAAVWIASCSCNAQSGTSGGVVTAPLTVYDNDGPALSLNSSSSVVKEGGETEITVSRNTETSAALAVKISTDHDSALEYPATVTIPAGQTSAKFTVKSIQNDVSDDSFTAVLTVESEGFAKANVWFMVTDQTLPDAQITAIELSATEIEVGTDITVTATLTNTGSYELPELTKVGFYHSGSSTALATAYLQAPLSPGESVAMSKTVSLPNSVGTYNVYAVANDGQAVKELLYTNNTSTTVAVNAVSPFAFTVQTDKEAYQQGEAVEIFGRISGKDVADKAIEVYVINDGYRHVINLQTDETGAFSTTYQPYAGQMGHFAVGACYPKEGTTEALASFDVYGIKRTSNSYITCEATMGEDFNGSFEIKNPGVLPVSGAKVTVASSPDNCAVEVSCPANIAAGATADVAFKITPKAVSEGNDWQHIVLNVETNEGAKLETILYYYCYNSTGELQSNVSSINTTMTKGVARDYPIIITNRGKGETGEISLSLPAWIKTLTPAVIPSLAHGDSTNIIFRFMPNEEMALNVAKTGTIGINCANGIGLSLDYNIIPVSEATGRLIVDVCDNYTYYTAEAPHLSDAKVVIKNPSTGAVAAEGNTDASGIFEATLPEGYYSISVTADKHESYSNYIIVDPGRDNKLVVDLPIETISIDWRVVETEIEDEYSIEAVVVYETNVPAPVVKIDIPRSIDGDNMAVGESVLINMTLTNVGLITAQNNTVLLPHDLTEWEFEALAFTEPFDLVPQQSVIVPVRITRINDESATAKAPWRGPAEEMYSTYSNCMAGMADRYEYLCGDKLSSNAAAERLAMKACATAATVDAIMSIFGGFSGGGGGGIGGPGGGGGSSYGGSENDVPVPQQVFTICDPCDAARAEKLIDALVGKTWLGMFNSTMSKVTKEYQENRDSDNLRFVVRNTGEDITDQVRDMALDTVHDGLSTLYGYAIDVYEITTACDDIENGNNSPQKTKAKASDSHNAVFDEAARALVEQIGAFDEILLITYGDRVWYSNMDSEKYDFLAFAQSLPDGYIPTEEEMLAVKPESVTLEQMYAYVRHLNGEGENFPTTETLGTQLDRYEEQEAIAEEKGYNNVFEYFEKSLDDYAEHFNEMSSGKSVCASISLKLSQTMTMTRQAFRGTLTVFNGNETTAMTNLKLNLVVKDESGKVATAHEFQINPESLTGFTGNLNFNDGWDLDAQETGVATILFIPTKFAAPTVEKLYSFGGTLSYIDPFTGLEVTRTLTPITLTVKPSPNLDLTYFMQRDIIGDDPLTEEIEPCQEAEFSLLINNIGYGDATNVRMTTNQPEIVDNEKGLLIDFELMSSQLNGGDKTLALGGSVATDFGTIPAKSTAYAQWWLKSSLLGHFTDYDVEATHVTSYGNPDLSLLNDVTIHELIRSLEIGEGTGKMAGFLTNDIVDAEDTPDMLYLSDGNIEPVSVTSAIEIVKSSENTYTLMVTPLFEGWNYGNLSDPTYGVVRLNRVVRQSDGREISLRNFWQTDRTLRDGKDPLYENRIHFADNFASAEAETYILTFEPMPELQLEVAAIEGVPAEGTIAHSPVETVNVMFNKPVDPATFTTDDISLAVQGKKQNVSLVNISTDDNKTFALDFTELNKLTANGYYVLTIQTADITDAEGFNGKTGKSVGWNMYKDGLILLNTSVNPADAGTIQGKRSAQYGETVSLTAEANEGYTFSHWTVNDEENSRSEVLTHTAISDADITAYFTRNTYLVTVDEACQGGYIAGSATGIYYHGDELRFQAVPDPDHTFAAWYLNGTLSDNKAEELILKVVQPAFVSAKFDEATSGVEETHPEPLLLRIYTLQGQLVNPQATKADISHLPPGLYIINGHKYLVK